MIFINKKHLIVLSLGFISISSFFSCTNRNKQDLLPACETNPTLNKNIQATLISKCYPCHNPTSANYSFPDLSNYASIVQDTANIKDRINRKSTESGYMPLSGNTPLSDCELSQITKWIISGAPNN